MPTTQQLVRKGRKPKKRRRRRSRRFLNKQPQRAATVIWTKVTEPRKPNSGKRHIARVVFDDSEEATVFIPGEGHNLQPHSRVHVCGGSSPDMPGVNLTLVRGRGDLREVDGRKQGRSRYGTKK